MKLSRATLLGMTILILIHLWRRYVGIRRVRRNIARLERALAPRPDIYGLDRAALYGTRRAELEMRPGAIWAVDDIATVHVLPTNHVQIMQNPHKGMMSPLVCDTRTYEAHG